MALMDFLFGKQGQEGQLEPNVRAARDFLLDQLLAQYSAGPVNIPQYMAVAPAAQYSGANALLSSLGLEGVSAPSMPTTNIGGMEVYTSAPYQTQMESDFAEKYPGLYDYMRSFYMDPETGEFGERSYGYVDPMATQTVAPVVSGGGNDDNDNSWSSSPTATRYSSTGRAPTIRPRLRPTSPEDTETTFGADLSRSLSDRSYNPEGTVVSRALDRMFGRG